MKKKLIPKAQLGTILQNTVKYRFYNTIGSRWGGGIWRYRGSQFLPEIKVTPENKSIFNI